MNIENACLLETAQVPDSTGTVCLGDGRGWWKPAVGQKVNPQDAVTSPGNLYWCPALTIFIR